MHVGHLRPLNIGRALYNIYTISKNECISDIHLGDWGIPISQILTFCYENSIVVGDISIQDLKKYIPKQVNYLPWIKTLKIKLIEIYIN